MIALVNMKQAASAKSVSASTAIGLLKKLSPPQAIIHIGAGSGYGEMHQWRQWDVPHALIIDANRERLDWAQPLITGKPGWHIVNEIVADTDGEIDYYQASNPEEDGIISPQQMSGLWPNLRTTIHSVRPCRSLDSLLTEDTSVIFEQATPVWVYIDCLPVLPILKGAGEHIDRWSVLWLRVLLQQANEIDEGATLQSIESYLQPLGFRCIEISESNHPAIGYSLFARDWRAVLQSRDETLSQINTELSEEKSTLEAQQESLKLELTLLGKSYDEQVAQTEQLMGRIETLTQERDSHASQVVEQQRQIEALIQSNATLSEEKSVLAAQMDTLVQEISALTQSNASLDQERKGLRQWCDALEEELDSLTQAHNVQAKYVEDGQARIKTLEQERDDYARELAERQAQIEALSHDNIALNADREVLTQEKSELAAQYGTLKQEVTVLVKARDELMTLANQRLAVIETQIQERDHQAKQLEELQGQIDSLTETNSVQQAEKETLIQEKSILETQRQAHKHELATLSKARDEQNTLANQRQGQIDSLTQIQAEQTKMITEYKTELEQLQLKLQQSSERIAQLEREQTENDVRQHLLNEEMIKAEAQIELIKDVLLREPGL